MMKVLSRIAPKTKEKPYTILDDVMHMRRVAAFTSRTIDAGKFRSPFGAEVVATPTGQSLCRRVNSSGKTMDPTAHAEVHVIRAACRKLRSLSLRGYTLYTTCEPCPMCMAAALWAGLDRVVFGATIDDAARYCGQIYSYAKDLPKKSDLKCEVVGPVAQAECVALFEKSPMRRASAPAKK